MAEGSRLDLSLHQVGRIHRSRLCTASCMHAQLLETSCPAATQWSWWRERSGPTRSLSEHGSETLQRRRYCGPSNPGKIGRCQDHWVARRTWLPLLACALYSHVPTRGGAVVARRAHNPKVSGSNPLPATKHRPSFGNGLLAVNPLPLSRMPRPHRLEAQDAALSRLRSPVRIRLGAPRYGRAAPAVAGPSCRTCPASTTPHPDGGQ